MKYNVFLLMLLILLSQSLTKAVAQCHEPHTTIVLSLDGFRWDYADKAPTPNLDRIAAEGVKARSLIPSFPSKTFPNHYTIATGLVPDHHGLVNNSFYDPEGGLDYSMSNHAARNNPDFYGGEPIWITASKQRLRTASFYWVGSDVAIQGRHPDYWKKYDEKVSFTARIDTIVAWLNLPADKKPRLIMAYYHEPDGVGHEYGPYSDKTMKMVTLLDSLTGLLYQRIQENGNNCVNLIIVSDHGMGPVSAERTIVLRDYIPESWPVRLEGGNPIYNIYAQGVWIDSVAEALSKAPHLKTWKSADVPGYLHYGTNPRAGQMVVVADSLWSVQLKNGQRYSGGTHGYVIDNTDMHAIFYAIGPDFKKDYQRGSFSNTEIYGLLAHLLGIHPASYDGDFSHIKDLLTTEQ